MFTATGQELLKSIVRRQGPAPLVAFENHPVDQQEILTQSQRGDREQVIKEKVVEIGTFRLDAIPPIGAASLVRISIASPSGQAVDQPLAKGFVYCALYEAHIARRTFVELLDAG
jgi:hypothetical protein